MKQRVMTWAGVVVLGVAGVAMGQAQRAANRTPAPAGPKLVPPAGNEILAEERKELEAGVAALAQEIEGLKGALREQAESLALLPDVEIYRKAVEWPLKYREPLDVKKARAALKVGLERARQLREGKAPWVTEGGARAYVSKIDDSVQPYVLFVPKGYRPGDGKKYRLDFFCHGRDEKLVELNFVLGKAAGSGDAANIEHPEGKFVVHPYGRFCNANKFAGEVDVLEVLEAIKRQYPIDEDRIVMTGFSMGGASAWHLAAHYADKWAAASPGAGFAETARYQKLAGNPAKLAEIPWWEQTLWHWYDATDYAANLFHCPTIAYAGDEDPQKQSGDVMEEAMAREGLKLERIWGEKTGHKYEPAAKKKLDARLDELAAKGRERWPAKVRLVTYTLRYNRMHWVTVDALEKHWTEARVEAELTDGGVKVRTKNVAALSLTFEATNAAYKDGLKFVEIDGVRTEGPRADAKGAWTLSLRKENGSWGSLSHSPQFAAKRHGLQGPIDDAFLSRFLIVRPTGKAANEKVGAWANAECERAIAEWRRVFRGEPRVKRDDEVTGKDMAESHLVLFGDPSSNRVLEAIAGRLPVDWDARTLGVGDAKFDVATHAPVLICPNPINPSKYVVLNSGFTFRAGSTVSNSRQTPWLPDYAIVDVTVPADQRWPGKVVKGGFFGEQWEVLPEDGKR